MSPSPIYIQTALDCLVAKCDLDSNNVLTTKPCTDTDTDTDASSSSKPALFVAIEHDVDASCSLSCWMFPFAIVSAGVALLTYQRYTNNKEDEKVGLACTVSVVG
mmetsp:Transcript_32935/g.33340  ORF Transcript_32935/g.33340 Transcript_32935/m.33340 type:complete len:105 (+) Transcript_32935:74-388(+)